MIISQSSSMYVSCAMQTLCNKLGVREPQQACYIKKSKARSCTESDNHTQPGKQTDRQTDLVELRLCLNNSASVLDHNYIKEAVMLFKYMYMYTSAYYFLV